MATITQRGNSYRIRVSVGYDKDCKQIIRSMTWKPDAGMTKRQIEKELNRQATLFEEQCKQTAEPDPEEKRQVTFKELAEEYLTEQERTHTIKTRPLCDALYAVSVRQTEVLPIAVLLNPYIRLPSDSASRRTPLPLANSSYSQVCSGLPPPSRCPCRAQ